MSTRRLPSEDGLRGSHFIFWRYSYQSLRKALTLFLPNLIPTTVCLMSQPQLAIPSFSLISTSLVVDSVVFLVLANAAVALRFYARKIKRLEFKWDDWTIVISLVRSLPSFAWWRWAKMLNCQGAELDVFYQYVGYSWSRWCRQDYAGPFGSCGGL